MNAALKNIGTEMRHHAPFTLLGTAGGVVIMVVMFHTAVPRSISEGLFWTFHPIHVFLSALVTAAMYKLHSDGRLWRMVMIGYLGSVGIATLSDSLIPFAGESLLDMPHRHAHLGFIEKWWLVNPLALAGILLAYVRPRTKFPHAGHVLLSTWASLFHITMALGEKLTAAAIGLVAVFLFLAVWLPCCTSDIVFPLLFVKGEPPGKPQHAH
jgi:hypothetical protein